MHAISTPNAPKAIGPYSQGIQIDDWIFTSGQIPLDANGMRCGDDIAAQTGQVLDNLAAVLADRGAALAQVVKVTVFMTDLAEFAAMNEVFARRFGEHRPARSTVQVAALPIGARVEIEAVACLRR